MSMRTPTKPKTISTNHKCQEQNSSSNPQTLITNYDIPNLKHVSFCIMIYFYLSLHNYIISCISIIYMIFIYL